MATSQSTVTYRDIPDFPGYRVGDDGFVWSCWKRVGVLGYRGCISTLTNNWQKLKIGVDARGRCSVSLRRNGKQPRFFVATLVLLSFVGPRPNGMECCHFPDRDTANNRLDNLRWDTKLANADDKRKHGTMAAGERNGRRKLSQADVVSVRLSHQAGESYASLGRRYGLTRSAMKKVVDGTNWKVVV